MLEGLPKETSYSIMIPDPMRDTLSYVATCLHGNNRRMFMAKTVKSLGVGGQRCAEHHLPQLAEDIESIVKPESQTDPTFRTDKIYTPLTAKTIRVRLIEEKGYTNQELPVARSPGYKMNNI